ncbi:MAG: hypothetical protein RBR68_14495 [Tenuifilaceae bacterium]|nr:hypothetical protein [Tenuifilaceae bacterium]
MAKVINMVQHALSGEQEKELGKLGRIECGREILPSIYPKIATSPNTSLEIGRLVNELYTNLLDLSEKEEVYVHLPLGSPAFMFKLGMVIGLHGRWKNMKFVFSHSERVSIDEKQEDGSVVKRSVFKFSHLIEL